MSGAGRGTSPGTVPDAAPDQTGDRLRAAGLRATRPRRLVLEALERLGGHRRADEVAEAVAAAGGRLARQSVYNALDALARAGLVAATDVPGTAARYEVAGERHHHLVCRVCGRIVDVEGPPVDLAVPGAVVESATVVLRGVCPDCVAG